MKIKDIKEGFIEAAIRASGFLIIAFVVLVFLFLLKDSLGFFKEYSIVRFLTGKSWLPISDPEQYGFVLLLLGSIYVTVFAAILAIPLGVATAMFIAEVAPPAMKTVLKSVVEILASIPSVVLGFVGIVWLGPMIKDLFHLSTGMCGLTAVFCWHLWPCRRSSAFRKMRSAECPNFIGKLPMAWALPSGRHYGG